MKPVDQRYFAPPKGDCWAACVATILEQTWEELAGVRHAYAAEAVRWNESGQPTGEFDWNLIYRALHLIGVHPAWVVVHPPWEQSFPKVRGYSIISGKSPRGDWLHSVVALDGVTVHDPHPSRLGLDGPVVDCCVLVSVEATP